MSKIWMSVAGLALLVSCGPAAAQEYPWCAIYHDEIGARTCGFDSYAECMETARGGGAYCEQNAAYKAPDPTPAAEPEPAAAPVAKKPPRKKKAATSPKPQ